MNSFCSQLVAAAGCIVGHRSSAAKEQTDIRKKIEEIQKKRELEIESKRDRG